MLTVADSWPLHSLSALLGSTWVNNDFLARVARSQPLLPSSTFTTFRDRLYGH